MMVFEGDVPRLIFAFVALEGTGDAVCHGRLSALAQRSSDDLDWVSASVDLEVVMSYADSGWVGRQVSVFKWQSLTCSGEIRSFDLSFHLFKFINTQIENNY